MPRMTLETAHSLGREEAKRRLQAKFQHTQANYGGQVSDLHEQWNDGQYTFGFKAVGMKIGGSVSVEDTSVRLDCDLPIAAMMFKGMIEQRIRAELGDLLIS